MNRSVLTSAALSYRSYKFDTGWKIYYRKCFYLISLCDRRSSQIPAGLNQVAVIHFVPGFSECGEYVGYLFIEIQRQHHLLGTTSLNLSISAT